MDWVKEILNKYGRSLIAKWVLRGVGYGVSVPAVVKICGQMSGETQAGLADWLTAGIVGGLTLLLDYVQQRLDRKPGTEKK